jgi:hypothetical protein
MPFDYQAFKANLGNSIQRAAAPVGDAVRKALPTNLKDNFDRASGSLQDFGKDYSDNLIGGLAGAAVGGGIGAYTTDTTDDDTFWDKTKHRLSNALTGAVAGGAVGGSAPTLYKAVQPAEPKPQGFSEKAVNYFDPRGDGPGAKPAGVALGAAAGGVTAGALAAGPAKLLTLGSEVGSVRESLERNLASARASGAAPGAATAAEDIMTRYGRSSAAQRLLPYSKLNRDLGKFGPKAGRLGRIVALISSLGAVAGGVAAPSIIGKE